jgi:hypothetical protein
MFVRICRYFPFSARLCLNQHHWLARRMEAEGIRFRQGGNMFLTCTDPARLETLGESLSRGTWNAVASNGLVEKVPHTRRYRLLPNGYHFIDEHNDCKFSFGTAEAAN